MNNFEKNKLKNLYIDYNNGKEINERDLTWIRNMIEMFPKDCRNVYDEVHV